MPLPVQPDVTQKPLDPAVNLSRGFAIPSGEASAGNTTNSSTGTGTQRQGASNGASLTSDAAAEAARQEKLGAVLVNLGGATEEQVFGSRSGPVMQAYREHRVPDLLVINRRQDDAAANPFVWYQPWTWLSSGQQVSPLRWEHRAAPAGSSSHTTTTTTSGGAPPSPVSVDVSTATSNAAVVDAPLPFLSSAAVAAVAADRKQKRKKAGLPPVVMVPLTDAQVTLLTPLVREDRQKLLASEERIHKVLQGIEDTRYKYLVPSQDLSCERAVHDVVVCYQRQNAVADKKRLVILAGREAEAAKGFSNRLNDEDLDVPIVLFDALACGAKVSALKKCTAAMVASYSDGSLD